jgi:hypothetical protein
LLVKDIYKAKVDAERDSVRGNKRTRLELLEEESKDREAVGKENKDKDGLPAAKREIRKIESLELQEYREYFIARE